MSTDNKLMSFSDVAHAWHDWAYYFLVVVIGLLWFYDKLCEVWPALAWHSGAKSESQEKARQARLHKLRQHALWMLLAAAFLVGVVRYEARVDRSNEIATRNFSVIDERLKSIDAHLAANDIERLGMLSQRLDPAFRQVFGPYIEKSIANLQAAVSDHEITLGAEEFRTLYIETMVTMRGRTLLALSYPTKEYFWDKRMMDVVAEFVNSGGVMKRIFFLDGPVSKGDDAFNIMAGQHAAGVEVSYVFVDDVPRDRQRKFLVEESGFFAWYVVVDEVGKIEKSIGTSDRSRCLKYVDEWKYLRERYAHPFDPSQVTKGPGSLAPPSSKP